MKVFKILVIGDAAVGKTAIATRYTTGAFKESHLMTLGANFMLKDLKLEEEVNVRLQIWDTAGQERFRRVVEMYYKNAQGVILTFSVDRKDSFDNLSYWRETALSKVPLSKFVLVANKIDLPVDDWEVSLDAANELSKDSQIPLIETSAKTNTNVDDVFTTLTKLMVGE